MSDWSPAQYERFREERSQPFQDLLALVETPAGAAPRVVDLGCGTGELTQQLHRRLSARETIGIDSSPAMLEKSAAFAGGGLRFVLGDLAGDLRALVGGEPQDVVFSNAALHWLPDHPRLFARVADLVADGGQLAVQMPANHDHPSHLVANELAGEAPFRAALGGWRRESPLLLPEEYSLLLHRLGFRRQQVRLVVYAHLLEGPGEVVEWVRGTLLTDFQRRLDAELFAEFLARYRAALLPRLEDARPYLFPFKRVLLWARR